MNIHKIEISLTAFLGAFWISLSFSPALAEISWVGAFFLWCIWRFKYRIESFYPDRILLIILVLWILFVCLSATWSEFPKQSFRGILKVLQQTATFIIVADFFSGSRNRKTFEVIFLAWSLFISLDGFIQYFGGRDILRGFPVQPASAGPRVTASFKSYGLFASYLLIASPFIFMLGLKYRNIEKKWLHWYGAFITIASFMTLMVLTRSRGAYLAMFASLFVILCLRKKFIWLSLLVILSLSFICVLPKSMILHLDTQRKDQSLIERYHLWKRAVFVIQERPLTGTGINTYASSHMKYDKSGNWRVRNYYAHNGYLQMAAEIGIPGLILFLAFLLRFFQLSARSYRKLAYEDQGVFLGAITGILGFLFFSVTDTVMHNTTSVFYFWFMLAIAVSYLKILNSEKTASIH